MKEMIRNINDEFGDPTTYDTVDEFAQAILDCEFELPEDGLKEGRDYEIFAGDDAGNALTIDALIPGDYVTDGSGQYAVVKTVPCGTAKYYANAAPEDTDGPIYVVSDIDVDYVNDDEDD